jgi:5'-3' exoribonuclease 2
MLLRGAKPPNPTLTASEIEVIRSGRRQGGGPPGRNGHQHGGRREATNYGPNGPNGQRPRQDRQDRGGWYPKHDQGSRNAYQPPPTPSSWQPPPPGHPGFGMGMPPPPPLAHFRGGPPMPSYGGQAYHGPLPPPPPNGSWDGRAQDYSRRYDREYDSSRDYRDSRGYR